MKILTPLGHLTEILGGNVNRAEEILRLLFSEGRKQAGGECAIIEGRHGYEFVAIEIPNGLHKISHDDCQGAILSSKTVDDSRKG